MKRKQPAEKARADTAFARLATDPDAIRGGTALTMMLEMIRAHRDKRSPEPGAVEYWGTVFDAWIMDPEGKTLIWLSLSTESNRPGPRSTVGELRNPIAR